MKDQQIILIDTSNSPDLHKLGVLKLVVEKVVEKNTELAKFWNKVALTVFFSSLITIGGLGFADSCNKASNVCNLLGFDSSTFKLHEPSVLGVVLVTYSFLAISILPVLAIKKSSDASRKTNKGEFGDGINTLKKLNVVGGKFTNDQKDFLRRFIEEFNLENDIKKYMKKSK